MPALGLGLSCVVLLIAKASYDRHKAGGALVLVWAWGWRSSKATSHRPVGLNSLTPYLPVLIGVALLRLHVLPESWIKEPLLPHPMAVAAAGLAITVLGVVFAIWSRVTLGRNWSSVPQVKEQHELVVKGPYRIVRHPIYTGLILTVAGTGLALDRGIGLFMAVLVFASYWLKSRVEEKLMMETFPEEYPEYRRRVSALIPGIL
jgi:protein-S-isoprenylcysteine O-methyltransferase Ste14